MTCYHSCVVEAPADEVWATLSDFHELAWAGGVVDSVEIVGDKGAHEVGAKRVLNGAFHETLQMLDPEQRVFEYSIDDGPGPVSKDSVQGYVGRVRVAPITHGGGTFVEWSSRWKQSDGGVEELCNPIYEALMGAMVAHFG